MLGAIAGDVVGSIYEFSPAANVDFPLFHPLSHFTDDTVLTVATAHVILTGGDYTAEYRDFARRYPNAGYGARFYEWMSGDEPRAYNSFGNGSAMRVAPVGFAFDDVDTVLREARRSAAATHDHPEGIKGAQAVALAVLLARTGASKEEIRRDLMRRFEYDLERSVDEIRPHYTFDETCQGSVPEAIVAFLDSSDFESAIRLAVSLGGDSDTQAAIAGGIAHAFYGDVPAHVASAVLPKLPPDFLDVVEKFAQRYRLTA